MANHFRSVLAGAAAKLQSKVVSALTSQQTVLPDNGYDGLSEVTINPQSHSGTVTISSKYETGNGYDMGDNHSKRYIKTSGLMATPTATKSITSNGTGIDVIDYAKVNVSVPGQILAYAYAQTVSGKYTTAYSSNQSYMVATDDSVDRSITAKVAGRFWSNKTGTVTKSANQVICSSSGRDDSSTPFAYTLFAVYLGPV